MSNRASRCSVIFIRVIIRELLTRFVDLTTTLPKDHTVRRIPLLQSRWLPTFGWILRTISLILPQQHSSYSLLNDVGSRKYYGSRGLKLKDRMNRSSYSGCESVNTSTNGLESMHWTSSLCVPWRFGSNSSSGPKTQSTLTLKNIPIPIIITCRCIPTLALRSYQVVPSERWTTPNGSERLFGLIRRNIARMGVEQAKLRKS